MAPRKRKAEEPGLAAAAAEKRVTRGSARRAGVAAEPKVAAEPPAKKEVKGGSRGRKKAADKKEEVEVVENGKGVEEKGGAVSGGGEVEVVKGKAVVIEHCKQCNSFKTRAIQVKNGLEKGIPGIIVEINPEKPRRGCFEIRDEDGEKFISLLDMPRPFKPMKALDMEKLIADIIDKIKE